MREGGEGEGEIKGERREGERVTNIISLSIAQATHTHHLQYITR